MEERKELPWLCALKLFPFSLLRVVTLLLAMATLTTLEQLCNPPTLDPTGRCEHDPDVVVLDDQDHDICPKSTTELISFLAYIHILELSVVAFIALCLFLGTLRQQQRNMRHWWTTTTQSWYFIPKRRRRPQYRRSAAVSDVTSSSSSSSSWWHAFCQCCCACTSCFTCCLFGGSEVFRSTASNDSSLSDISIILADFFNTGSELDITPSDVLVGISALSMEQRQQKEERLKELRGEIETSMRFRTSKESNHQTSGQFDKSASCDTLVLETDVEQGSKGVITIRPFATGSFDNSAMQQTSFDIAESENSDDIDGSDDNGTNQHELDASAQSVNVVQDLQMCRADSHVFFKVTARRRLNFSKESDRRVIQDGSHYMRYALAVYGHVFYIAENPCSAPCYLLAGALTCRSGSSCSKVDTSLLDDPLPIVGDGIFGCNQLGFLLNAGLHHTDLVYASFKTGIKASPYVIAVDREKKSVVVAIKGTFSLESLVTDLNVRPELMSLHASICDVFGESLMENEYCHSGMLHCAVYLYKELERTMILDQLLLGDNAKLPGYSLVITGHSLGAGCAAILSIMFQNKFPGLQCLCFAPPGCVVSLSTAQDCNITSYILDSDIVPRLSVHSVVGLRNDILEMIARISVPKHKVLGKSADINAGFAHRRESIPLSPFYAQVLEFKEHQEKLKIERNIPDVKLYPPGRLVHLIKNKAPVTSFRRRRASYIPVWAELGDFAEIALTKSFFTDHDPEQYMRQLTSLQLELQLQG